VAAALANLAQALTDGGHLVSAEAYLQQALQMSRGGDRVPSVESADILQQFGQFELGAKSDPQAASKLFRESLEIYRADVGNQSPAVASILNNLADSEVWTADYALAERDEREAIRIFQATVNRNHPDHATALENLGIILTERGKFREAEQMLSEALDIETNVFGANNQRVANIESHLGILYDRQGDLPRAVQATRQAVRIATDKLGTSHYLTGYYLDSLANVRQGVRERFRQSLLLNPDVIVAGLEGALRHMWRRWCTGASAESFQAYGPEIIS